MTENNELRDAVRVVSNEVSSPIFDTRYTVLKQCLQTLLALATRYLELGGVVEEKVDTGSGEFCETLSVDGYNDGRQDTLLAIVGRLEGVEDILLKHNVDEDEYDLVGIANTIRNHILNTKESK